MQDLLAGLDPFDVLDVEATRLDGYFDAVPVDEWSAPSRCAGWTARDVLGHLAGEELYHHACLDDALPEFFERARAAGADTVGGFNEWCVRQRRDEPVADVLAEWHAASAETRRRLRALGAEASVSTMAGRYPVWLQTFHIASEYATHADDVGAYSEPFDEPDRTHWRARLARLVLAEQQAPAQVSEEEGRFYVRLGGASAILAPAEFVEASVARLPADHPLPAELRAALRCLS